MAAVDDGVLGVELAVGLLEGLGDALDALDDVHGLEQEGVDLRGVADDADDGLVFATADVGGVAATFDPVDEVLELFGVADCLTMAIMGGLPSHAAWGASPRDAPT